MKGCHELLSPTCCSKQDQLWDKTLVFRVQLSRSWKVPKVQTTQVLWGHFIHSCGIGSCAEKVSPSIHMKPFFV